MRISSNILAMRAAHVVGRAEQRAATSTRRLSTGLKINCAKDDAAGFATSTKMRLQTTGTQVASRNSSNGISITQTADAGLAEIHSILQRVRELAVMSSNETLELSDIEKTQLEIDQLKLEIDSISDKCEFNKIKLLGGSAGKYGTSNTVRVISVTDDTASGVYKFNIISPAENGMDAVIELVTHDIDPTSVISNTATYSAEGNKITIKDIGGQEIVVELPPDARGNLESFLRDLRAEVQKRWEITNQAYDDIAALRDQIGSLSTISEVSDAIDKLRNLADTALDSAMEAKDLMYDAVNKYPELKDYPDYQGNLSALSNHDEHVYSGFYTPMMNYCNSAKDALNNPDTGTALATAKAHLGYAAANALGSRGGGAGVAGCSFVIADSALKIVKDTLEGGEFAPFQASVTVHDGGLVIQTGANKDINTVIQIPKVNTATLDVFDIDFTVPGGSQKAIIACDAAIGKISKIRTGVGAVQNKFEYTIESLDGMDVTFQKSLSRMLDTDMALELSKLSQNQIVTQAGVSVLAQANQRPQAILQLLSK